MVKFFKKIGFILVILVVIFIFYRLSVFNFLDIVLNKIAFGINKGGAYVSQIFEPIFIRKNLIKENEDLKNKIFSFQKEIIDLKSVELENKILREQFNFLKKSRHSLLLVNIIGQEEESGYHWFILDRGSKDDIEVGYPVVDNHGYLVGKIIKVEAEQSFMLPILDSHFLTTVDFLTGSSSKLESDKVISGLVQGRHGLSLEVNFIPIDYNLNKGDYLITSGSETNIPRGLIVGVVENMQMESAVPFQRAIIKPFISLSELRIVSVIVP